VAERDQGSGILLVSTELDEILALSDRILVMFRGRIVAETSPEETTASQLGLNMAGVAT
jgi:simple sugar transport system ATP-binding protein